jgi:hypothetical protein
MTLEVDMQMSLHMIFGFSLALLALSAGCHNNSYAAPIDMGHIVFPQDIPQDLMITLERAGCFGPCPIYKLAITADGAVIFEGRRFVKEAGATKKSAINQEQLKELMAEIDRVKFFLDDDYSSDSRVCNEAMDDLPLAITSIRINGKSKTVSHYYGCTGPKGPIDIAELKDKIDQIVNTTQWLPDRKGR